MCFCISCHKFKYTSRLHFLSYKRLISCSKETQTDKYLENRTIQLGNRTFEAGNCALKLRFYTFEAGSRTLEVRCRTKRVGCRAPEAR